MGKATEDALRPGNHLGGAKILHLQIDTPGQRRMDHRHVRISLLPETVPAADRLSARYLVALAGRAIREVGDLLNKASAARRSLPSLALDADLRFRSAADRAAFAEELTQAVTSLAAKYHDEAAAGGRWHRLVVFAHPRPKGD